nr:probable trehalase [Ipomoea batatas]
MAGIETTQASANCVPADAGPVVPTTPLVTFLERLQEAALRTYGHDGFDPKKYVDMALKEELSRTVEAFQSVTRGGNGSIPRSELEGFMGEYLVGPDKDLVYAEPVDFVGEPEGFLSKVENPEVRKWGLELHLLWKNLSRKVGDQVLERPGFHTLLPLKNPVIIPGSRFQEVYYWDSYWVIRGLLAGKMYETAKGIVANLISLIDQFGYVLNGARAYYSNRRMPQDTETASKLSSACEKKHLYREIATTAESGWDFSSRWMRDGSDLTTLATTSVLPVDLNAFILKLELDIVFLASIIGENHIVERFNEASQARKIAINSIFWDTETGQWYDYWLSNSLFACEGVYKWDSLNQNKKPFASNFVPLWIDLFNKDKTTVQKTIQSLQSSGLLLPAGIAMTLSNTGQQWDFPNGWAPLQHIIVEGLTRSGSSEARSLAQDIARRWIRTNYVVYKKTGAMYEKYDVEKCGQYGGGGEYVSQTGFGWSNGVVLAFLEEFGWPKDLKMDC